MKTSTLIFKTRIAAIILIAAGYGWAGGHFIPANSQPFVYLFQFVMLFILMVLSLGFLSPQVTNGETRPHARWAVIGLNIFAAITLAINIANVVRGTDINNHDAFGSHNTLADLVPIALIMLGDILWLIALVFVKTNKGVEINES